jgi:glucan phosphorylase
MPLPEGHESWTQEQIDEFLIQHKENIENANKK